MAHPGLELGLDLVHVMGRRAWVMGVVVAHACQPHILLILISVGHCEAETLVVLLPCQRTEGINMTTTSQRDKNAEPSIRRPTIHASYTRRHP